MSKYALPLLLNLLCIAPSNAAVVTVYTEQYYPLNYTESGEDDAPIVGFSTDLVISILNQAKVDYELSMTPWVRAMRAIDNTENVLVYSMTRTPAREAKYHWIGEILPLKYYLYGLKSRVATLPRTIDEARNYQIGVIREDVVNLYLTSKGFNHLVVVKDPERYLHMLKRGRIDLFPYSSFVIGIFAERHGFRPDDLIGVVQIEEISTGMYLAASKNTSAEIINRLRDAYQYIRSSGRYDQIFQNLKLRFRENLVEIIDD